MIRIGTFATQELSMFQTLSTQSRVTEQQLQLSSGKVSRDYAGLSTDSRRLLSMEDSLQQIDGYLKNIDNVTQQLTKMESSVASAQTIASDLRTLLVNALNADTGNDLALPDQAQAKLDQLAGLLNTQYDGRYLFGGARIDAPPVDFSGLDPADPTYDPANPTTANAGYYQGDGSTLSVRIDKSITLDYGIKADEPGFEKLARALVLTRDNGAPGVIDRTQLEQALALAEQAVKEIPEIRSGIGHAMNVLEDTKTRHGDAQVYAEQVVSDIEDVDIAEVMTRLAADQTQLEASYMVSVRLSQVSLMNFLR